MDIDNNQILELFNLYYTNSILDPLTIEYLKEFANKIFDGINKPKITEIHQNIETLGFNLSYNMMKYINDHILDFNNMDEYRQLTLKYAIEYFYIRIFELLPKNLATILPKDIFITIFNNDELRWLLFGICPSPFPTGKDFINKDQVMIISTEIINNEIKDAEIAQIISQVCNYLKVLYAKRAIEFIEYIGNNIGFFRSGNNFTDLIKIVIILLRNNIRSKKWNLDNSIFYISSLYDNDILDLKTPLSHKLK